MKYDDGQIIESPFPAYMPYLYARQLTTYGNQNTHTHHTFVSIELLFQSIFSKWETFQFNSNKDDRLSL